MRWILSASALARLLSLGGSVLLLLTLAAPASAARIGIPKKVKDTVSKSAEQKASPQAQAAEEPVVFDDLILELTEERIGAVLAACGRVAAVSAGRPPLVAKLDKANEERSKLYDKYEEKIRNDQIEFTKKMRDFYQSNSIAIDRALKADREKQPVRGQDATLLAEYKKWDADSRDLERKLSQARHSVPAAIPLRCPARAAKAAAR